MHTREMSESEGTFGETKRCEGMYCPKCSSPYVSCQKWDSHCGGYTDIKFTCDKCNASWWIEGPDS